MDKANPQLRAFPMGEAPDIRRVICDLCGHQAIELHCKIRCLNCGYMRDCSDP